MKTLAKIVSVSIPVFLGCELSVAQVNNNPNANQVQVQTQAQPQPQSPNQAQPSVLSPNMPLDGAYKEETNTYRRVVPPAAMREADIMWKTRIWRNIDTREKINLDLYYPLQANANRISLFELLKDALLQGEISAYQFDPVDMDDCDKVRLTKTEVQQQLFSVDTVVDENGNLVPVKEQTDPADIRGYTIKEDWHFEKQRSVLDPRILFICPRIRTINKNTGKEDATLPPTSLFWLYFPDIRPLLAKTPVFNEKNDAAWPTFDDIFWKRIFSSYIIQQSNNYDRTIASYMIGVDALLQGEKINNDIRAIEDDMWSY